MMEDMYLEAMKQHGEDRSYDKATKHNEEHPNSMWKPITLPQTKSPAGPNDASFMQKQHKHSLNMDTKPSDAGCEHIFGMAGRLPVMASH